MGSVPVPRPGVKYTRRQIARMRQAYPDLVMPGYAMQMEDGLTSFVPTGGDEAMSTGPRRGKHLEGSDVLHRMAYRPKESTRELFPTNPIKKRTAQERTDSMMDNLVEGWKQTGTIPGLSEEKVSELVARSWKRGQPLSAEDIRIASANLLAEAEGRYEASEGRKVVRTAPSD